MELEQKILLGFTPVAEGQVDVLFSVSYFTLSYLNKEGYYDCYIPTIDIFYNAKTKEDIHDLARSLTTAFFKHWIINVGVDRFVRHLRVLDYNPTGADLWQTLLKKKDWREVKTFKKKGFKAPAQFQTAEISALSTAEFRQSTAA